MSTWPVLLLLLGVAVVLAWGARRLHVPVPIVLVIGGLALAFIPGLPVIEIDPHLILLLVLPPVLYHAAIFTPWREFRANLQPISMLAIGLVVATTGAVAVVAATLIPGFGWGAAFVLGAIVSPPDAVAATAVFSRLRINRRTVVVLEGESLVNDATGLVVYKFVVAAVVTGAFSIGHGILEFLALAAIGSAIGVFLGYIFILIHRRIGDPMIEIVISILSAYAIYMVVEYAHGSGVLAVVAAGLMRGWHAPAVFSAQNRMQGTAVWDTLLFLLNGFVFILIGLQMRQVFDGLVGYAWHGLLLYSLAIGGAAIAARLAWVMPSAYIPRLFSRKLRENETPLDWRNASVMG